MKLEVLLNHDVKGTPKLPTRGTAQAAGLDIYMPWTLRLRPNDRVTVETGVRVSIPEGHVGLLIPRSSWGRRGVKLQNTVGVIDSDYRGDLSLMLCSESEEDWVDIHEGERVAQLLIIPCVLPEIAVVEQFSLLTERGEGGFGSTGR